jgi:hypothetical protein
MSDDNGSKAQVDSTKWSNISDNNQRIFVDNFTKLIYHNIGYINHYARLMTNWLYALSVAGIGLCVLYKPTAKLSLVLFVIALVFAIVWALLEYIRSSVGIKKQMIAWNDLTVHNGKIDKYMDGLKENKSLFWCITGVAIIGYVLIFLAFILSFTCK